MVICHERVLISIFAQQLTTRYPDEDAQAVSKWFIAQLNRMKTMDEQRLVFPKLMTVQTGDNFRIDFNQILIEERNLKFNVLHEFKWMIDDQPSVHTIDCAYRTFYAMIRYLHAIHEGFKLNQLGIFEPTSTSFHFKGY